MIFDQGHDLFQVFRTTDLFFYIAEGKEFVAYQFTQLFGELLLSFRKNPLNGDPQNFFRFPGVKKHFDSDPVGHPANKSGNQGYQ